MHVSAFVCTAQAEVAELVAHVDDLQRQLEQTELECVNSKAQVATLTKLIGSDSAPQASPPDAAARQEGSGAHSPASAVHREPWEIGANECNEVLPSHAALIHALKTNIPQP